jgi:hypothetical protein
LKPRPCSSIEGAGLVERHVGVGHGLAVAFAVVHGFGGGQFALRGHQGQVAGEHVVGGAVVGFGHVLRHLAHTPARRDLDIALVGLQLVREQRKEARLASAVAADEADLLAGLQHQVGALQHDLDAAAKGDVS